MQKKSNLCFSIINEKTSKKETVSVSDTKKFSSLSVEYLNHSYTEDILPILDYIGEMFQLKYWCLPVINKVVVSSNSDWKKGNTLLKNMVCYN